jgi:hypothetical protein
VELGAVDLALVRRDDALVLPDQGDLRIELLLRHGVLLDQHAVAVDVDLRVFEQRPVTRHLSLGLRQLHLERPGIDLGDQIARPDDVALAEPDRHELSIDAAPHRHGRERRDRADPIHVDRDVSAARRLGGDRHRPCLGPARLPRARPVRPERQREERRPEQTGGRQRHAPASAPRGGPRRLHGRAAFPDACRPRIAAREKRVT